MQELLGNYVHIRIIFSQRACTFILVHVHRMWIHKWQLLLTHLSNKLGRATWCLLSCLSNFPRFASANFPHILLDNLCAGSMNWMDVISKNVGLWKQSKFLCCTEGFPFYVFAYILVCQWIEHRNKARENQRLFYIGWEEFQSHSF